LFVRVSAEEGESPEREKKMPDVREYRKPEYDVDRVFIERWSRRAMSGEEMSREELFSLFEAAKWAPSSFNNQPWRFLYAQRNTEHWDRFFDLLAEGNKVWAAKAAALVLLVSKKTSDRDGKPSRTHSFDAGAAWISLALQGTMRGLVVHAMGGFNANKAQQVMRVPEEYAVEVMIAVGKPGNKDDLPDPLREREKPSGRKSLAEIVMEGAFRR